MKPLAIILGLVLVYFAFIALRKEPQVSPWPFSDARNTAVFTTIYVMKNKEPITLVLHDSEDGAWQFFSNKKTSEKDAMVVSLDEIIALDPSIAKLADMPLGYGAFRTKKEDPWIRKASPK